MASRAAPLHLFPPLFPSTFALQTHPHLRLHLHIHSHLLQADISTRLHSHLFPYLRHHHPYSSSVHPYSHPSHHCCSSSSRKHSHLQNCICFSFVLIPRFCKGYHLRSCRCENLVTQAIFIRNARLVDKASGDETSLHWIIRVFFAGVIISMFWQPSAIFITDLQNFRSFVFEHLKIMDHEALQLNFPPTTKRSFSESGAAYAAGLFQMPPIKLNNSYFLMRAGESEYERKGLINTNPVAKTSVDNGLSENGKRQTIKAALQLQSWGACEGSCWIWPSITQRAYQAAEMVAEINSITRSRIVPEYSFLDARGLGSFEGRELAAINEVYSADLQSTSLRPPPYTDGTPNESVADVFVRVTQLMSILETQYSGDNIVIISPDSDNLSILQAGLTGLDLRRHSSLSFAPGEVRFIDISSVPPPQPPVSGLIKCSNPPNCR